MKLIFMGTPEFSVPALKALHSEHEICAVYTQPDRPVGRGLQVKFSAVKEAALSLNIPVFQPEKLSQPGEFEKIQALNPDAIVVVAYGQILKKNVLDLPRFGCINIHASLLPRWRGAAPIHRALLEGDTLTGVCTMKMVEKLDAGEVYLSQETKISLEDTTRTLHDRLSEMGASLILETLTQMEKKSLTSKPQDESQVTYAEKLSKELEILVPTLNAHEVHLRVRALNPWPGSSLWIESKEGPKRLKITAVGEYLMKSLEEQTKPSLIEKQGEVWLSCHEGLVKVTGFQWQGKKEVDSNAFINGLKGQGLSFPLVWTTPLEK